MSKPQPSAEPDAAKDAAPCDAVTGATSLAEAAAALDAEGGSTASIAAPPPCPPPGIGVEGSTDAATGATPGMASACLELGMSSMDDVVRERGIKPPGVA